MSGLSCEFYADDDDLAELVSRFREVGRFKYVEITSARNRDVRVFSDPTQILDDAKASPARPSQAPSFLVMHADAALAVRQIVKRNGTGTLNIADQINNIDSIVIAFGGNVGDETLVMSDIHTMGESREARELHKSFKALVWSVAKRAGAKGHPVRLMPGAAAKAKAGWRLARDKSWRPTMDDHLSAEERAAL